MIMLTVLTGSVKSQTFDIFDRRWQITGQFCPHVFGQRTVSAEVYVKLFIWQLENPKENDSVIAHRASIRDLWFHSR